MATPDALSTSTRIIYELLGRRWVWPAITTTEEVDLAGGQQDVVLHGRPVREVLSVALDGVIMPTDEYTLVNKHRVRILQTLPYKTFWCGNSHHTIAVRYSYGSPPPMQLDTAINVLAEELDLANSGSDECRLPERVTSISRQGISLTLVDPKEYFEKGETGIPEVDVALATFNPTRARRPVRVYSLINPPPRRSNTVQDEI